ILRVRPGVELVRASLVPTRELITLDLPTLERPRNAISGRLGAGNCAASVAAARKRERTLMLKFAPGAGKLASCRRRRDVACNVSLTIFGTRQARRSKLRLYGWMGASPSVRGGTACLASGPDAGRTILCSCRRSFLGARAGAYSSGGRRVGRVPLGTEPRGLGLRAQRECL